MNIPAAIIFLKAILPTKKITAWILGLIAAGLALVMGINNAELKAQFCASAPVEIPSPVVAPAAPAVAK